MESALPRSSIIVIVFSVIVLLLFVFQKGPNKSTLDRNFGATISTNSAVVINAEIPKNLTLIIKPEKRIPSSGNDSVAATFTFVQNGNTVYQTTGTTNNNGVINFTALPANAVAFGTYAIKIKGISHLTRKFTNVFLNDQVNQTINLTSPLLKAGDAHPSSDDYVNGLDISYLGLNLYGSDMRADQNRDGLVNSLDFSITLDNLYQYGDQ